MSYVWKWLISIVWEELKSTGKPRLDSLLRGPKDLVTWPWFKVFYFCRQLTTAYLWHCFRQYCMSTPTVQGWDWGAWTHLFDHCLRLSLSYQGLRANVSYLRSGLSNKRVICFRFFFSDKVLKYQNLWFIKKKSCFLRKCFLILDFSLNPFYSLNKANAIYLIFYVEKTFNALSFKMCGNYTKNLFKSVNIRKKHVICSSF